ncbi:MAG: hypothetical protein WBE79_08015 [Candidatus Cybelea sp.]
MPDVRLERTLRVPADPAAEALGELLKAIADQEGPWRGFALHIGLGDLRLPDVGYVAVPIRLTVQKDPDERRSFDIGFNSASLPTAFPGFKGTMVLKAAALGESTLYLRGSYELPMHFFGKLLDAALTPHVAERSLENFIEEIGTACEARVNQREAEFARYRFYSRTLQ